MRKLCDEGALRFPAALTPLPKALTRLSPSLHSKSSLLRSAPVSLLFWYFFSAASWGRVACRDVREFEVLPSTHSIETSTRGKL